MNKKPKILSLTLIAIVVLLSAICAIGVNAQTTATVAILDSVGGTVSADPAGPIYNDGSEVTLTATPTDETFVFTNWVIASEAGNIESIQNPLTFTVMGGATYAVQAVFQPIQAPPGGQLPPNLDNAAIVIILPSAGGTTNPGPGSYALADATNLMLTATPQSGWNFAYWTICGEVTDHGGAPVNWAPTENPYNVNHGYGYTYYYQAVFTQQGSSAPTPTPAPGATVGGLSTETLIIIALVVVIVVLLIGFGVFSSRKHK